MKKVIAFTLCMLSCLSLTEVWAATELSVTVDDPFLNSGNNPKVYINLNNDDACIALYAEIYVPAGFSIEQENGEYKIETTERSQNSFVSVINEGQRYILWFGYNGDVSVGPVPFTGNEGALFTFNLVKDENSPEQYTSGKIQLKDIHVFSNDDDILVDDASANVYWSPISPNSITTEDRLDFLPDIYFPYGPECVDFNGGILVVNSQNAHYRCIYAEIEVSGELEIPLDSDLRFTRIAQGVDIDSYRLDNGNLAVWIHFPEDFDTSLNDYYYVDSYESMGFEVATINVYGDYGEGTATVKNVIAIDESGQQYSFTETSHFFNRDYPPTTETTSSKPIYTTSIDIPQGVTMTINAGWDDEGEGADWFWESSNTNVVKVVENEYNNTCKIQAISPGTATISVTATSYGLNEYGFALTVNSNPKTYLINVTESSMSVNPCDVNGDGHVNTADITVLYNIMLGVDQ